MSSSVLGNLTLTYQPVWNRLRQPVAMHLFIDALDQATMDAAHVLGALAQTWSEQSPVLILSIQSSGLLADLLEHAASDGPWIAVQDKQLADPRVAAQVHAAHRRAARLLWRGEPGQRVDGAMAACFARSAIVPTAGEALLGLRASLHRHRDAAAAAAVPSGSPVLADQIYEGVGNRILAEHCLDEQGVWGVAGWPTEDVLHGYRHQRIEPSHRSIVQLVEAIDADTALEAIEHHLTQEPLLVYRFLCYANSAAFGARAGVDSLRHALMLLGLSRLRLWLLEQLPHASSDLNLHPVRAMMVLRARLMALLLDAGEEDTLRGEVVLCGLLSQIDLLLGEPLAAALQRLALSERIGSAILGNSGPYAPFLDIATALEYPGTHPVSTLCDKHEIDIGDVNRALLRVLSQAQPHPARGRLLE